MTTLTPPDERPDFSLVMGGPLYQMLRRVHLSGSAMELLWRRIVAIVFFAWLPLLVLSAFEGHLFGTQPLGFLRDIESHVRLLVALPALIFVELIVHQRIWPVVKRFVERGVVTPDEMPKFYAAVDEVKRTRDSIWLELSLLVLVFTLGHWIWQHELAMEAATWYAVPERTGIRLTLAGYWYAFVSIPIFQFILLRWYLRLGIWFRFLWRVSRLQLRLLPAHPDRAGGIGFLGRSSYAFGPLLFAQGTLVAGLIASRILFHAEKLKDFNMTMAGLAVLFVLVILGPLAMFTPQLSRAKRRGLSEYGALATVYVAEFDEKWIGGGAKGEEILGTADIQSLADLANSYAVVKEMRLVPFGLNDVTRLAAATALPVVPLFLTIMPLEELVTRLLKIIF
ncbi:MAG: hypothetical protein WCC03_03955 [Candidatus Acidiferrales bacterium]